MSIQDDIILVEGGKEMVGSAVLLSMKDYKKNKKEQLLIEAEIKRLKTKLGRKKAANTEIKNFIKECAPKSLDVDRLFEETDQKILEEFKAETDTKHNGGIDYAD